MSYQENMREHQRICILRMLNQVPDYSMNESMIADELARWALSCSRDQLKALLAWLVEQGLIACEPIGHSQIARITLRGQDVANGLAMVPGVKRPSAVRG
ncbi:MAG: hypothetical protein COB05_04460 [Marinobacter sp.]|nr:MAG: hypothetical protein COB05_04460 [Marinobacter sp.]